MVHAYPIVKTPLTVLNFCLELALAVGSELSSRSSDGRLASFLNLGLEDDLVAFSPHFRDESLTRNDNTSKTDFNVLEGTEALVDGLSSDAEGAETVKNRGLEATDLGEGRVDVKRATHVSHDSSYG
jgi:hypothetical protein